MTKPVLVRHPVPVCHVPLRGRVLRADLLAHETPVALRDADQSEFEEVARVHVPTDVTLYAHDGGLWHVATAPGGREVAVAELLELLESPGSKGRDTTDLTSAFLRSPVMVWTDRGFSKGDKADVLSLGRMDGDQIADGEARLRDLLDRGVRLVGDRVFLRTHPLARPHVSMRGFSGMLFPHSSASARPMCDLWRVDELLAYQRRRTRKDDDGYEARLVGGWDAVPRALLDPDGEQRLHVNRMPRLAWHFIGEAMRDNRGRRALMADLRRGRDALAPWVGRSQTGTLSPHDLMPVLEAFRVARDALVGVPVVNHNPRAEMGELSAYAETVLVPRNLGGGPLAPEDEDAFSTIAPGGL